MHQTQTQTQTVWRFGFGLVSLALSIEFGFGFQESKIPEMQHFSGFFHSFIYGVIELEKLITNIYILFRFNLYLAEKTPKKVE
jgi:hypothetical protein